MCDICLLLYVVDIISLFLSFLNMKNYHIHYHDTHVFPYEEYVVVYRHICL